MRFGCYPDRINQSESENVGFDGATVNGTENAWRHLRNGIRGIHVWVSLGYVERHANNFG